jgi:DNA-binding PadR family transcriptional regulator
MADRSDAALLSAAAFHILVALAGGPRHGYAILKEVAAATGGEVKLNAGTLYTTIKRLLEEGLVRETGAPARVRSDDERRRYYAITAAGRRAAEAELARLKAIIEHAAATLDPKPAG